MTTKETSVHVVYDEQSEPLYIVLGEAQRAQMFSIKKFSKADYEQFLTAISNIK